MSRPGFFKSRFLGVSLKLWSLWPPFIGSGISIDKVEMREGELYAINTRLKLRFWNSNYVGTQFGGSLFSMSDPFYMVLLLRRLGAQFVVWDKSGSIRYRRPGRTDCFARFEVPDEELKKIRETVLEKGTLDWNVKVLIRDQNDEVVAEVDKVLYIATREFYEKSRLEKSRPDRQKREK